jgi:hypothetical protein
MKIVRVPQDVPTILAAYDMLADKGGKVVIEDGSPIGPDDGVPDE